MEFYIGVWTKKQVENLDYPFIISIKTLLNSNFEEVLRNKRDWMVDSGGFTELRSNGKYTFSIEEYLNEIERVEPNYFFVMDWMCEPSILKKTGLSIREHQINTLKNYLRMKKEFNNRDINSKLCGVIQGWKKEDYLRHIEMLKERNLITDLMGVGSICRRFADKEIIEILKAIKKELPNTKLHGFGVKKNILKYRITHNLLYSCDSMAWSYKVRYGKKLDCDNCISPSHSCRNCYKASKKWINKIEKTIKFSKKQQILERYLE